MMSSFLITSVTVSSSVLPVIERLGGKHPTFVEGDIRNEALMTEILHDHAIDTVIHFAGLAKAVGESVQKPLEYYDNNVNGTLRLISAMRAANVKNFIFSSSATVYGDQPKIPYVESYQPAHRKALTAKAN